MKKLKGMVSYELKSKGKKLAKINANLNCVLVSI